MGFLGVKTYRKRLTGAVRSFLSYSEVISGRFGEKQFFYFFRPLFEPISNHIGLILTIYGPKTWTSIGLVWPQSVKPRQWLTAEQKAFLQYKADLFIFVDSEGFFVCPKKKAIEDMIFEGGFSFPSSSSSFLFCQKGKQLPNLWSLFLSFYFLQNHFRRFIILFGQKGKQLLICWSLFPSFIFFRITFDDS